MRKRWRRSDAPPPLTVGLQLLARLNEAMLRRGRPRPILISGAAVEYFSGSALMTGDIDLSSPAQPEFGEELRGMGFTKPNGIGHTALGRIHPGLRLVYEVVANIPMGGTVDYRHLLFGEGDHRGHHQRLTIPPPSAKPN